MTSDAGEHNRKLVLVGGMGGYAVSMELLERSREKQRVEDAAFYGLCFDPLRSRLEGTATTNTTTELPPAPAPASRQVRRALAREDAKPKTNPRAHTHYRLTGRHER